VALRAYFLAGCQLPALAACSAPPADRRNLPLQVYDAAARVRLYEESVGILEQITGKALPGKLKA
jgi:hypothetical protein